MTAEPISLAAASALYELIALLDEARGYLVEGETLAAIRTLVMFDERADDLGAAMRLLRMAQRRKQ